LLSSCISAHSFQFDEKVSFIFLLSFGVYWASFGQAKEETNVLLMHVDALIWADIGVFGTDF